MERIESRIEELLTDVAERLELLDEEEHSQKELDEMMSMLEDYFDQVRSNQSWGAFWVVKIYLMTPPAVLVGPIWCYALYVSAAERG